MLYVGAKNPAQTLYNRVGFHEETPGAEHWLEIGFDGAEVGHW